MSGISNEAGRCQEFPSSFFDFLHLFYESLHLFLLDQAHPCACAGASRSLNESFAVVDLCFVSTLRAQPRHFITWVLPISNEAGRCQEFPSSFFDFLHLFYESLHLFLLDQAHPCACAGASRSLNESFAVVDLCFVSTLRAQPRHFITWVLPTKHLFDPDGP